METTMRLSLHTFLTLDGVMQAPGGPDEDPDGGFAYGGWSFPYGDEDFGVAMTGWFEHASAFLLGRKTYQIFSGHWPRVTDPGDPIAAKLNTLPKYVASTTLASADWQNSSILSGDVAAEVAKLKEQPGDELQVHGSGALAQTLIDHDLIDEYRLLVFPVHLGAGKKLFRDGAKAAALRLISATTTGTGVVIATYQPDGPVRLGSYALDTA
jgi:dihydrofolate reductase